MKEYYHLVPSTPLLPPPRESGRKRSDTPRFDGEAGGLGAPGPPSDARARALHGPLREVGDVAFAVAFIAAALIVTPTARPAVAWTRVTLGGASRSKAPVRTRRTCTLEVSVRGPLEGPCDALSRNRPPIAASASGACTTCAVRVGSSSPGALLCAAAWLWE